MCVRAECIMCACARAHHDARGFVCVCVCVCVCASDSEVMCVHSCACMRAV